MTERPLRGDVWLCSFPQPVGPHPAAVLTLNRYLARFSGATVAVITGTEGAAATHVPVGRDAGLTKYRESYVNCADLVTIRWPRFRRRLGRLSVPELRAVEFRVRELLGLD